MDTLNYILTAWGGILLNLFVVFSPQVPLAFWSVVTGLLMALVFRHVSNQTALRVVADQTRSQLLAIRLFKDDLGVALGCQIQLLKAVGLRLFHSVLPAAVMLVPIALVLIQLALRYEHTPLTTGESVLVEVELSEKDWETYQDVEIEVSDNMRVQTPGLRDSRERTIAWRVAPIEASEGELQWRFGDRVEYKNVAIAKDQEILQSVSVRRTRTGWLDRILHPGEASLEIESPVRAITMEYPKRSTPFFGLAIPWWATFLIVSMLAALATKPWLKVQF